MGLQWGDEAKGKVVDLLAPSNMLSGFRAETMLDTHWLSMVSDLHSLSFQVGLRPESICCIGNGVVVDQGAEDRKTGGSILFLRSG